MAGVVEAQPIDPRREVPGTDALLAAPELTAAAARLGAPAVKRAIRRAQQQVRDGTIDVTTILAAIASDLPRSTNSIEPVINATGVIVHTNLGRAPLSAAARRAVANASGYATVELELRTGQRARRGRHVLDALVAATPGAEGALVVNNNAAALVLVAMALATDREIVISRGELLEIGDGFRIAAILTAAGANLREVGSTNRTTLGDYAEAISPRTGFVIKVHQANFAMSGYTGDVGVAELAALPAPLVVDIGSGLLNPHPALPGEPDAANALAAGADLVTASGDKLLGGPQAGIILGRADLIDRLRRHPVARAVRVDKLTLAALEATLDGSPAPVLSMITEPYDEVHARARRLAEALRSAGIDAAVVDTEAAVGGGAAPTVRLASAAVALAAALAEPLRLATPAVLGRVERGRCLLDLRTVSDAELAGLEVAIRNAASAAGESRS